MADIAEIKDTPAPRPWNVEWSASFTANGVGHVYIVDATGRKIAAIWGKADEKGDTAALIVRVVNAFHAAIFIGTEE